MNTNHSIPEVDSPIPENAMSVYGQNDAMDDFPVLKAFQQYVDAEHAKAQKRMTTLCIFFSVVMVAVIGVFVILLTSISNRNNSLSDQLLTYLMRERDGAGAAAGAAQEGAAVRAMTESLSAMQRQMMEQQSRIAEQQMQIAAEAMKNAAARAAAAPALPVTEAERSDFTAQKAAHERQLKSETERLRKLQDELMAERASIAQEKDRLHQREIELQRRRLYPELYEGGAAPRPAPVAEARVAPAPAAARRAGAAVDAEIDADIDAAIADEMRALEQGTDGSIRYFDDEDAELDALINDARASAQRDGAAQAKPAHLSVPVSVGGEASDWDIPLN